MQAQEKAASRRRRAGSCQAFWSRSAQSRKAAHNIDLKEEGWTENDRFPKNEEDYVKMGFF